MSTDMALHAALIRADTDRLSAVARTADLTAPVAACPDWDISKLIVHVGFIHRWATVALKTAAAPEKGAVSTPGDDDDLAVWIVEGASRLIDVISTTAPDAPTWHPFPFEQVAWVMARRQALETAMHRWDAQTAANTEAGFDPRVASEGIQEYFELGLPRVLEASEGGPPTKSLHVHCTDIDGEWLVWSLDGEYQMLPVHDKGDAAIRGTAADIWLLLMGRLDRTSGASSIDIVGDPAAAHAWLDLPNW